MTLEILRKTSLALVIVTWRVKPNHQRQKGKLFKMLDIPLQKRLREMVNSVYTAFELIIINIII